MKVIRVGGIVIFLRYSLKRTLLTLLFVGALSVGFMSAIISILVVKTINSQKLESLERENMMLRETIKSISSKYDKLYAKQKVLAQILNLPFYEISSENLAIGGQISDVDIDKLLAYADFQEKMLSDMERKLKRREVEVRRIPSIPPVKGVFSSGFGVRKDPFTGGFEFHKGIDITAPEGIPIIATADGIVEIAGWNDWGYGNQVVIDHQNGIKTRYAHMLKVLVRKGQKVKRGQIIGLVGSTGKSIAPHVHYEVYVNGKPVNPLKYILVRWP